jgi:signal transduction histidine kinase
LVIIAHGVAFIQFKLEIGSMPLPLIWRDDFNLLLIISLGLALVLPFCQNLIITWVLLLLRCVILWAIVFPFGSYLGIELVLLIALITESFEYTTKWQGMFFSFGLIGIGIIFKCNSIVAWGETLLPATLHDLLSFGFYTGFFTVLCFTIRYLRDKLVSPQEVNTYLHEATLQLAEVNMQLQEYAVTVEQDAIINERKRIAREIHDTLGYTLTNLLMMIEAAKRLTGQDIETQMKQLEKAHNQTKDGIYEVRRALQALRPTQLAEATGLTAIKHLVNTFAKATQIEVILELGNAPLNFNEEAELVSYRLVQEGLTNALRHGRATKITVSLTLAANGLSIHIKDNGIGAQMIGEGYGLTGMRERINRLGGKLEVYSYPGEGFTLIALIPLKKEGVGNEKD